MTCATLGVHHLNFLVFPRKVTYSIFWRFDQWVYFMTALVVKSLNQKIVTGADKLGHPFYN